MNQYILKIKKDLQEGCYSLKKVLEEERDPSKVKRVKKLWKKIKKAKEKLIEEKMLLFFELEKELEEDYNRGRDKNDRLLAWRLYKSFEKSYSWIPINKDWKLRHFSCISIKNAENIAHSWISMELNLIEGENMWQSQSQVSET